ncbi:hypothetical protein M758_10G085400 [Ceratodon purpureus]|nr:hypothetical protein M758_10G085400 [Ceratodon purpureus]
MSRFRRMNPVTQTCFKVLNERSVELGRCYPSEKCSCNKHNLHEWAGEGKVGSGAPEDAKCGCGCKVKSMRFESKFA